MSLFYFVGRQPCPHDPCAAKSILDALAFDDNEGKGDVILRQGLFNEHTDTFYDCLEYAEDEASDQFQYDVGRAPLTFRGGGLMHGKSMEFQSSRSLTDLEVDTAAVSISPKHQQPPPPPGPPPTSSNTRREFGGPPPPPTELPDRFLRAGKMDSVEGMRRYQATLKWRREERIDYLLKESFPNFDLIQANYPLHCHLKGLQGESVYYEKPPKTNLKHLKANGAGIDTMLRYYTLVTEFGWQWLDRSDSGKSVYIIDLKGIKLTDFAGEVIDFVRKASAFTGAHYPERSGCIFVINVPSWFKMIWSVVKPMIDEDTLKKIYILRGQQEIFTAMLERIPIENIPAEYGGKSVPLGQSPEDQLLKQLMYHNNALANKEQNVCAGTQGGCQFCHFQIARSY